MNAWTLEDCQKRIKPLRDRFEGADLRNDKIRTRRKHFHRDPEVNPVLPPVWSHAVEQCTFLEETHWDMKARLMENHWLPQGFPAKDTATSRSAAEKAEMCLVQLFDEYRKRTGIDIQGDLVDGMGIDGPAFLHWRVDGYEGDYQEYLDELDELTPEQTNYTKDEYAAESGRTKSKTYRESDGAAQERLARAKAESGGPLFMEVLNGSQCFERQDKSQVSEFSEFLVVREIGYGDYYDQVKEMTEKEAWESASGDDAERDSPIENVQGTRVFETPSSAQWGDTCTLQQYWTRTHCYEILTHSGNEPYFRAIPHHYGMPPFSKCVGRPIKSGDPVLADLPYLNGMYTHKPSVDRLMSLRNALSESGAMRVYFLVNAKGEFKPLSDETGNFVFTEDGANATAIPDGYQIQPFGGDGVSRDFANLLEQKIGQMKEAAPSTGRAEFGVSTQPWSARIQTSQENREPKAILDRLRMCIEPMINSVVKRFGDPDNGPGPVAFYPQSADGNTDTSQVLVMDPEEWRGLTFGVNINPVDSAEQITKMEHGRALVADPLIMKSPIEFIEEDEGKPNPEQVYMRRTVDKYVRENMVPGFERAAAANWAGPQFLLTPDGNLANMAGQQQKVTQVAQAVGGVPIRQPQPQQTTGQLGGQNAPPGPATPTPQGAAMPNMAPLQAPQQTPMNGLVG